MLIEDGKFYFIKNDFFDIFKDYKLMDNKGDGTKRPCYFCFRDRKNKEIIWFVPISTKYDKYKKIYDNKKIKAGNKRDKRAKRIYCNKRNNRNRQTICKKCNINRQWILYSRIYTNK